MSEARHIAWDRIEYRDAVDLRQHLLSRYSVTTANLHFSAFRSIVSEAYRLGMLDAERYLRLRELPRIPGRAAPRHRRMTREDIATLLAACPNDLAGIRDRAVIAVLYGAGLRRAELSSLDLADYDRGSGQLVTRRGKGGAGRVGWLLPAMREHVAAWLYWRGDTAGPLFLRCHRWNQLGTGRIAEKSVFRLIRRRALAAGLGALKPHDLRRALATHLADAGTPIPVISRILGHQHSRTTDLYIQTDLEQCRAAIERL